MLLTPKISIILIYLPVSGMICILSLVYRKKKVPENPPWQVVYSETMVKTMIIISDYTLVLKEDIGVFG